MARAPEGGLAALVNPRTGVVRRLTRYRPEPGDAPLVVVGADVAAPAPLGGASEISASGAAGFTWDDAARAAVGEACERYAAGFAWADARGSAREVPGAVGGWALFSERQYARPEMHYRPWSDDARLAWVRATRLADGAPAHVPAQFVFLPWPAEPHEPVLAPTMSTGLAAAGDLATATLHALYEVVERDAFTLAWLHRAVPPRVDEAALPARVRPLARHARLHVFDLTHDVGLPTYLCVLEQRTSVGTVRVVGAATRHDPAAAVEKAVVEAFQSVPYVRELVRNDPGWTAGPRFENLRDFRDHARFYTAHPEHREGLAHLLDAPREGSVPLVPPRALPATPRSREGAGSSGAFASSRLRGEGGQALLADVVARLAAVQLDAYVVDLTTDDLRDAGLRVVRALVPGAQPLHGFYQVPHLAGPRFLAGAAALPYLREPRDERTVNAWPHPFA